MTTPHGKILSSGLQKFKSGHKPPSGKAASSGLKKTVIELFDNLSYRTNSI
jgi:hypothetical protein